MNEKNDNSIVTRDFIKIYHQERGQLNSPDQNFENILGEKNYCHQLRNAYHQFDITVKKSHY